MRLRFFRAKDNYVICREDAKENCAIEVRGNAISNLALIAVAVGKIAKELHRSPVDICKWMLEGYEGKEKEPPEAGTSDGSNEQ